MMLNNSKRKKLVCMWKLHAGVIDAKRVAI